MSCFSRRWQLVLLSLFGFLFAVPASAATTVYYYTYGSKISEASASLACAKYVSTLVSSGTGSVTSSGVSRIDASHFNCNALVPVVGGTSNMSVLINQLGNGCDVGYTYNSAQGSCDYPSVSVGSLCDDQTGGTKLNPMIHAISGLCVNYLSADPTASCSYLLATHPSGVLTVHGTVDASGVGVAPGKVSAVGGMCEGVVGTSNCVVPPAKCTKGLCSESRSSSCLVSFTLNGRPATPAPPDNGLAAKNDICLDASNCNLPDPQTENDDQPCTKVTDAEGRQSCSVFQYTGMDGTGNCGSFNGVFGCTGKSPTSTGTETVSTTTTKSNADGTTTDTTNNTATQTNCNGFGTGSCSSSVTNSQTTTVKNSSGATTSTGTTCSGKACSSTSNPDTNGDGIGDCVKDCTPNSGNSATKLTAPAPGNFDGEDDKWDKKINDAKVDFKDRLDKLSGLFKPISNINLGGGGHLYCPPAVSVLGHDISFCLDQYAGSLSWISQVILLVCTVSALFIIFL
jgi:hypothetical protein